MTCTKHHPQHGCMQGHLEQLKCASCYMLSRRAGVRKLGRTCLSIDPTVGPATESFFMSARYIVKCAALEGVGVIR